MEFSELSKTFTLDSLTGVVGMSDADVITEGVVMALIRRIERGRTW
jgi:hypothetical protein